MNRQLLLQKFMKEELHRYESLKCCFETELDRLPKGAIIKRNNGSYSLKYRENQKQFLIALTPADRELYQQLKLRKYISEELPILKNKIKLCENFLEKDQILDPCRIEERLQEQYQGTAGLNIFLEDDIDPEIWKKERFNTNPFYKEHLVHPTERGLMTRSKAEAMIGTQLERSELFFRYEAELKLKSRSVFPDFTILHPILRRLIYWEHLGKIDDLTYMSSNLRKLKEYAQNGIFLGYNLIITFESRREPLTMSEINTTIQEIIEMK